MDEQMMRERIRSLEEHTDKLVAQSDALKAQSANLGHIIAERDAEIERLRQQVDAWQATGNAIMLCAVGREAPLSDSDVCGEINALRQQVAELQADITELYANIGTIQREAAELKEWKAAVPVASVKRLLRAAPDDDVSEWIKFAEQ